MHGQSQTRSHTLRVRGSSAPAAGGARSSGAGETGAGLCSLHRSLNAFKVTHAPLRHFGEIILMLCLCWPSVCPGVFVGVEIKVKG